jgi:hypothetical protein
MSELTSRRIARNSAPDESKGDLNRRLVQGGALECPLVGRMLLRGFVAVD